MSYRPRLPLPVLPTSVVDAWFRAPIDSSKWSCEGEGCEGTVKLIRFNSSHDHVEAFCTEHAVAEVWQAA